MLFHWNRGNLTTVQNIHASRTKYSFDFSNIFMGLELCTSLVSDAKIRDVQHIISPITAIQVNLNDLNQTMMLHLALQLTYLKDRPWCHFVTVSKRHFVAELFKWSQRYSWPREPEAVNGSKFPFVDSGVVQNTLKIKWWGCVLGTRFLSTREKYVYVNQAIQCNVEYFIIRLHCPTHISRDYQQTYYAWVREMGIIFKN